MFKWNDTYQETSLVFYAKHLRSEKLGKNKV